jgi:hypothetical protein
MIAIISTAALAILVALAVICALLVRVCNRLDVLIIQAASRREWERK